MSGPRLLSAALALVVVVSAPVSARAQREQVPTDEAQVRFDEGVRALRASDWAGALSAFEASRALRETGSVVFNIAGCLRTLRRFADARRAYQRFLEIGTRAEQRAEATRVIDELAANVASLTVTTNVDAAEILLDGRPLGRQPVDLDVGSEHVVEARAEGHRPGRETVLPAVAGPLTVELVLDPVPPPVRTAVSGVESPGPATPQPRPAAPEHDRYPSSGRTWPWIVAGAALVVAGGVLAGYFLVGGPDEPTGDLTLHPR